MNRKQQKQLIGVMIALAVLILLLCVAVLVTVLEEQREQAEAEASIIYVPLAEDAAGLAFTDANGEALSFTKDGDSWSYDGDSAFPLSQSTLSALADAVNGLTAGESFLPEEELSSYGLESPITLTVTDSDGTARVLSIGGATADGSYYYATLDGEETVYTIGVSLATRLDTTLYELAETPSIAALTSDNLISVTLTGASGTTAIAVEAETVTAETVEDGDSSSATEPETTTEYHWLVNGADVTGEAFMEELISDLKQISLDTLAAFQPDSQTRSSLGLDQPVAELTAQYTGSDGESATVTLTIGSASGADGYYCILNGDDSCIWTCDADEVGNLVLCAVQGYEQAQADAAAAAAAEDTEA